MNKFNERSSDEPLEMYEPKKKHRHFNNPLSRFKRKHKRTSSFRLKHDIKSALIPFLVIVIIGLGLNYIYYQNFSLYYLFIGGVNDWFSVLQKTLNYGITGGYDILYLIVNGIFYAYLYFSSINLIYQIIKNITKKETILFLIFVAISLFFINKLFPNIFQ